MNISARPGTTRISTFTHLSILALLAAAMVFYRTPASHAQTTERTKVAEGEYLSHEDNPYGTPTQLRQTWILWRVGDGRYLVENELHFNEASDKANALEQTVFLSNQLRPLEMKM